MMITRKGKNAIMTRTVHREVFYLCVNDIYYAHNYSMKVILGV